MCRISAQWREERIAMFAREDITDWFDLNGETAIGRNALAEGQQAAVGGRS
jgi:hypothetical protein